MRRQYPALDSACSLPGNQSVQKGRHSLICVTFPAAPLAPSLVGAKPGAGMWEPCPLAQWRFPGQRRASQCP